MIDMGDRAVVNLETTTPDAQPSSPTSLRNDSVSERFLRRISRDFARTHLLVSQGSHNGVEHLAVSDHTDPAAVFNVGVALRCAIETAPADGEAIARLIDEVYGRDEHAADEGLEAATAALDEREIEKLLATADRDLLSTSGKGPIVRLVDALLFEALGRRASDVHVQPLADRALVRYRLDGVLHSARELPPRITTAVISRIKVMGRMDIAERRIPQDGRATVTIGSSLDGDTSSSGRVDGRAIDLRISTLPTSYGERAVIRLLDNTNHLCEFNQLGMPDDVADRYLAHARRTNGIILLTGPTGSGKTTTLYATLRRIGSPDVNIMTIEDPIEYELSTVGLAISQSQVNAKKGVTFASGLRHILRQDPDVVMVGEVRDLETARIAIQASLTGHLVLSTLHTNDSAGAVSRLVDLGIEPYLVSASLSAVMAQRLVRLVHQYCQGKGCPDCFNTGFSGRRGLFELLAVSDRIRQLIGEGQAVRAIKQAAIEDGMRTLHQEGDRLAGKGMTTAVEVERVVQAVL